jgi:hypothetical protein
LDRKGGGDVVFLRSRRVILAGKRGKGAKIASVRQPIITKVASHVHGHDAHEVLALVELPEEELGEEEEQHGRGG